MAREGRQQNLAQSGEAWTQAARERFQALVEQHQQQVYNLALRMLHEPAAAEDAAQDAFLAAYRHFHEFSGEHPRAWLLRIATNVCYDQLRRAGRRPAVRLDPSEKEEAAALQVADPGRGPEELALEREREKVLSALLMELAPDYRAAVVLCDVQGLSYEEAADATGAALGTVKSRLSRGRARLRELLLAHQELFPLVKRLSK